MLSTNGKLGAAAVTLELSALALLLAKDNLPNEAMPSTESTLKDEL